jgi:hypothetical protein
MLAEADRRFFGDPHPGPSRLEVIEALLSYVNRATARGLRLHAITRHILGLFQGVPGAKAWRRHLSTAANRPGAGAEAIRAALALLPEGARRGEPDSAAGPAVPALASTVSRRTPSSFDRNSIAEQRGPQAAARVRADAVQ